MGFSRCKTLLKLARITARNTDYSHEIGRRFYSRKVVFSSAPANAWHVKPRQEEVEEQEETFKSVTEQLTSHRRPRRNLGEQRDRQDDAGRNFQAQESRFRSNAENGASYAQGDGFERPNFKDRSNYGQQEGNNFERGGPRFRSGQQGSTRSFDRTRPRKQNVQFGKLKRNELNNALQGHFARNTEPRAPLRQQDRRSSVLKDEVIANEENSRRQQKPKFRSDATDEPGDDEYEVILREIKGGKQEPVAFRRNYKLADVPAYQTELKYGDDEEEDDEDESEHDAKMLNSLGEDAESVSTVLSPVEENQTFARYKMLETPEGRVKYDLSADEFDMAGFLKKLEETKPLDQCHEDISDFGPTFPPTFNFAAYADKSPIIQEFVKLGVKLYKVEKNQDHMRSLLNVNPEKDLPVYLQFLHDCGVPADALGDVITKNPMIFQEDMDDLKTRIRYLRAHEFKVSSIARIVTKNPTWLCWSTKHIDERLGHFQNEFKLSGADVRFLATRQPKLITYKMKHILENTFAVKEEMGFNRREVQVLLLSKPRLWMNSEFFVER